MSHLKALDFLLAYGTYIKCSEVELNESWNIRSPMKFWEFREKLSKQILTYKPTSFLYRDDDNIRVYVSQILNHQKRGRTNKDKDDKNTITSNTFKMERHIMHKAGRLFVNL